jgi:hypothetical protein
MKRALVLALALACGACTIGRDYIGNKFHADPRAVLRPGETTIAQALELFGAPEKIQRRRNGEVLIYRYVRENTSELELEDPIVTGITFFVYQKHQLKANRLTLFFDDAGILTAYGHTAGVNELDPL